ncbi:MAG: hypothetical protein HN348_22165 [Proteobacteria bacterium]|jgi:hypothetical protein|nr:hypothetical protein [Pseudomonadota bacterium]
MEDLSTFAPPLELLIWKPESSLSHEYRRYFVATGGQASHEFLADSTPGGEGFSAIAKVFGALIGATAFLGTCSAPLSPHFFSSGWGWIAFTVVFALILFVGTTALVIGAARDLWSVQQMRSGTWRFGIFLFEMGLVVRDRTKTVLALPKPHIIEFRSENRRSEKMNYWVAIVDFLDDQGELQWCELESPGSMSALELVDKLQEWLPQTEI